MINISIIGVTGSIGTQAIELIRSNKDKYNIVGVSAHKNIVKLIEIVEEFSVKHVAVTDKESYNSINKILKEKNIKCNVYYGIDGLTKISTLPEAQTVLTSVVGMVGLVPTIEAIRAGKNIALANKETLVVAGEIVMQEAKRNNVQILPVDSEHSAIFQCLQGNNMNSLSKVLLTASGGPFRGRTYEDISKVSLEEALKHPKWNMGKKITIDSATLMNKGLEVIEAHWLFDCPYDSIEVIVHPESIIHSMVQYTDGSVIAQLGMPDMILPIQYAFNYPKRDKCFVQELDLFQIGKLTFEKPDRSTFKCLNLAYEAGKKGSFYPTILNAANEAAVDLFLKRQISFVNIAELIEESLNLFSYSEPLSISRIIDVDKEIKDYIYGKIL
ncbi:1-deoxy-D-xylulose-5-phosphate reductoisomerase [Alloiococcus sp. CFN-8]|uniref:1-deoxy-D-xylulose-5-phosphate reductoisomerase n=1 Tax=Alloiococcus sp. CFN-8 TaxID=3416081 RepID=UPI003CEFF99C